VLLGKFESTFTFFRENDVVASRLEHEVDQFAKGQAIIDSKNGGGSRWLHDGKEQVCDG
jgi:hypothetical protein